ncbi:hypothetical protein SCHPADRAFT_737137 [Schizopora paradoxa]|uniref:Uncharacterized protein n=1 Tax=Schizopora paradoxa TaxID=27342 RepID=A0A0H2R6I1_9AGAM|nr:hypothetical protein SCHPADRAFT_737137 [Schizopora paradoxa]
MPTQPSSIPHSLSLNRETLIRCAPLPIGALKTRANGIGYLLCTLSGVFLDESGVGKQGYGLGRYCRYGGLAPWLIA